MTLIIVRKCNADHNDQRHDIKDNHTQNRKRQQRKMELMLQREAVSDMYFSRLPSKAGFPQ